MRRLYLQLNLAPGGSGAGHFSKLGHVEKTGCFSHQKTANNSVDSNTKNSDGGNGDAPNTPDLSTDGTQHTPALKDIGQAVALVRSLESENRERCLKNARIQDKYNAERPHDPSRLQADGLAWKSNFTTKPLATLIDKVVPRFTTALRNMRYMTASKLPSRFVNAAEKTEIFRREITDTCRGQEGWDELLSDISQENALFGFTALGWLDSTSWMPKFYRQDAFMVPQGTKHTARSAQVVCLREDYLMHELFDMISNLEAAKLAGWETANVIKSLNSATPDALRSGESSPERIYADLARESNVISSFHGSKTIPVWHVLIAEIDGHITHVAFDNKDGAQLYWKSKQFPNMSDAVAFLSFQHGNGKLHGSKGIGRELYNMAGVLDRARNEVVDRLQLSGKLVLQCDEREIKRFRMSVVGNAILISSGYNVQQTKIDGNVEPFFQLDRFLTDLLDQIAGSTSPKAFEGERVTKAAVELYAAREEERRDNIIERFLTQIARMMSTVQRRLCDERTIDTFAQEMQARLLEHMTREELDYLAQQPAVTTVQDYSEGERQRIILVSQEGRGNPLYNQYELEKRSLTAKIDAEFAEQVLLPQNDPTETNENVRQQKLEFGPLQQGMAVEVSPRDNHAVHLSTLHDLTSPLLQAAMDDPSVWPLLDNIGAHGTAHIQAAEAAGLNEDIKESKQWFIALGSSLQKLEQSEKEAQAEAVGGVVDEATGEIVPAPPEEQQAPVEPVKESISMSYKDAPESIRRQMEAKAGFIPATESAVELDKIRNPPTKESKPKPKAKT